MKKTDIPLGNKGSNGDSARGKYSGRLFNPLEIGGPIRELSYKKVRITNKAIVVIDRHISRFGYLAENRFMIDRLRKIAAGELEAEAVDRRYYTHELREYVRYRRLGWESGMPSNPDAAHDLWNNAHTAALEDYQLREGPGVIYHALIG